MLLWSCQTMCICFACRFPINNGPFSIPEITQSIKSESAHRINKALARRGPVWQDESFDHVLRCEESLSEKAAYVLRNLVRAGLVKDPSDYRWLWWDAALVPLPKVSKGCAGEAPAPTRAVALAITLRLHSQNPQDHADH